MRNSTLPSAAKKLTWFYDTRARLNDWEGKLALSDGLSARWQWIVFGLVIFAFFSRSPNLLTHAQFYAEDGAIWFEQAYNLGWLHALFLPQAGYLNTVPRFAAAFALLFPLGWAPTIMAVVGLLFQSLPVPILLSSRCRAWAPLPTRMVLAAIYVALPNSREVNIVATNSMWHLAVAAVLIAFAVSPQTWRGRVFDSILVLLFSVSGPFSIVLTPLILVFWWCRRQPWSLVLFALTGLGALTQILLVMRDTHRVQGPLGATPATFFRMLGGNVFACSLIGNYQFASAPLLVVGVFMLVGLSICLYCLRSASIEWKLFLVFCPCVYLASLKNPLIFKDAAAMAAGKPAWDMLVVNPSCRYSYLPMLMFLWSAVWCALYSRNRIFRLAGACVFLSMSIGIVHDWRYPDYLNEHFEESVQRVREAKAGERVSVPLIPQGWEMYLVKKGPS